MATNPLNRVVQRFRRDALGRAGAGATDGDLLGRFVERRDEDAFAVLFDRHGPMVLGVCRRVLRHEADAEDAFQATFLVLASKAATIRPREMVGNWLHGVARNTAAKAKAMNLRQREREREAGATARRAARDEAWQELLALLDEELGALPDKYRAPIVLCDLEGKTIAEAAAQLGWPQGTLATRLRRGRELLAKRLSGRGVSLTAGLLAVLASSAPAPAGVPAALSASTIEAAGLVAAGRAATSGVASATVAALTEGVLKSMASTKLKAATAVALALLLGAGGVVIARAGSDGGEAQPVAVASAADPPADPPGRPKEPKPQPKDADKLQGIWTGFIVEIGGRRLANLAAEDPEFQVRVLVKGDQFTLRGPSLHIGTVAIGSPVDSQFTFKLDEAKQPRWINLPASPAPDDVKPLEMLGVYELDGDILTLCLSALNKNRPAGLKTQERTAQMLLVLKRDPKGKWEELPKPVGQPQPPTTNDDGDEKPVPFEVRDRPWRDVLDWLTVVTGLPLLGDSVPPKTAKFNHVGPKGKLYTIPEVLEIINKGLAPHKLKVTRRKHSLLLTKDSDQEK